ncbi:MAG: hypothetical protein F7B11_05610 [Caldisphaeraceae archaeon]|nr:hypothetical protein [Caldisphaeraceae archaeon]MEB3798054.1 hypothetical protein [Caldisphaeraceae archaeon]
MRVRRLRSIVVRQLLLTAIIALVGIGLVALWKRVGGEALLYSGMLVILASPWLSFLIIYKVYKDKV